jgi:hypothetical protein
MRFPFRSFAFGLALSAVIGTARADVIVTGTLDHLRIEASQAPSGPGSPEETIRDWLSVPRPPRLDYRWHIYRITVIDLASAFPGQGLRPPDRAQSFHNRFHPVAMRDTRRCADPAAGSSPRPHAVKRHSARLYVRNASIVFSRATIETHPTSTLDRL